MGNISRALGIALLACVLSTAADATNYFVSASKGSDSNAGTSSSAPWQTINKVNGFKFNTSDSVYFLVGDTWQNQFMTVNWSGTTVNPVVIGAYYINSSGNLVLGPGSGNARPIIDDNYQWDGSPMANSPSCTGCNSGIWVQGNYVTIENIEVEQSGYGILAQSTNGTAVQNTTISNVFIDGAFQCGMEAENVNTLTIQNSEIYNAEDFKNPATFNQGGNWCSSIGVQHGNTILIQNNYIHQSWGEGTDVFNGSSNAIIRNNIYYANWAVGIYLDTANGAEVYGNMILGTPNSAFWRFSDAVGPGITLNNEQYEFYGCTVSSCGNPGAPGTGSLCPLGVYGNYTGSGTNTLCPNVLQNVNIYDNLVADTVGGIDVWGSSYFDAYPNVQVFNNTLVDNDDGISLGNQRAATNFVVQNNIFLSITSGTLDKTGTNNGISFNTNYWSQGVPAAVGGAFASTTDVYSGIALNQMSGWRSMSTLATSQDFAPTSSSSTLGRGNSSGLFFSTDYYGNALHNPVDLGAIAGTSTGISATVTPNPAQPGQSVTVNASINP
ncbi:MAG: right-handed parallel beta-helix repeat-containing protein, partial [Candidatus Sulfotelmatobacter sp.]